MILSLIFYRFILVILDDFMFFSDFKFSRVYSFEDDINFIIFCSVIKVYKIPIKTKNKR